MKVVFISGKYRGDIASNIEHAKYAAIKLWRSGCVVLCPHLNTAYFDGLCPDSVWLEGYMELLRRCDAVYFLSNWQQSEGALAEYQEAVRLNKELIFEKSK